MNALTALTTWFGRSPDLWHRYPPSPEPFADGRHQHALIASSRVRERPVFDAEGRLCGQVRDLSIEKATGQVVYALVSSGGLIGFNERLHPLPWSMLRYDPQQEAYVLAIRAADFLDSPHLTTADLEFFGAGDDAWRAR